MYYMLYGVQQRCVMIGNPMWFCNPGNCRRHTADVRIFCHTVVFVHDPPCTYSPSVVGSGDCIEGTVDLLSGPFTRYYVLNLRPRELNLASTQPGSRSRAGVTMMAYLSSHVCVDKEFKYSLTLQARHFEIRIIRWVFCSLDFSGWWEPASVRNQRDRAWEVKALLCFHTQPLCFPVRCTLVYVDIVIHNASRLWVRSGWRRRFGSCADRSCCSIHVSCSLISLPYRWWPTFSFYGITCVQTYMYYTTYVRDSLSLKLLVGILWWVSQLQTWVYKLTFG
jgi:hypothetical protein